MLEIKDNMFVSFLSLDIDIITRTDQKIIY
jgi:hypothetical protein